MGSLKNSFRVVLCLFSLPLFAEAPAPAPLEFWFYRPAVTVPEVKSEKARGDVSFGSNPITTAKQLTEHLQITGIRWEDEGLRIGTMAGSVACTELESRAKVPVINKEKTIFVFKNIRIEVSNKSELALGFPEEVRLTPQVADGRIRFALADGELKKAIDAQIDAIFSDSKFDQSFQTKISGELTELGRKAADQLLGGQRAKLLDQAREGLKRSLNPEELTKLLISGAQALPTQLPTDLTSQDWVLRRTRTERVDGQGRRLPIVLWRLVPASAPKDHSAYRMPNVSDTTRNVVTVVSSPQLLQTLIEGSFGGDRSLGEKESGILAGILGFDAAGGKVSLVATGERGPRVKTWSMPGTEGTRHFMDLLVTLRSEASEENHTLGIVMEFRGNKAPKLIQILPIGRKTDAPTTDALQTMQSTFGRALLLELTNSKLDEATEKWVGASERLIPLNIRALGDAGARSKNPAVSGRWAEALAVDFELR